MLHSFVTDFCLAGSLTTLTPSNMLQTGQFILRQTTTAFQLLEFKVALS